MTNVNCDDIDNRFQFYYLLEMALKLSTLLVYRLCNLRTFINDFLNETNLFEFAQVSYFTIFELVITI